MAKRQRENSLEQPKIPDHPQALKPAPKCLRHNAKPVTFEFTPPAEPTFLDQQSASQEFANLPQEWRDKLLSFSENFRDAPPAVRKLFMSSMLAKACSPQLSWLHEYLTPLLRLDSISLLPIEISARILSFLDAKSICRASQTCKRWSQIADDDSVWQCLCEQHINKTCKKCGWNLPLMMNSSIFDSVDDENSAAKVSDTVDIQSQCQSKATRRRPWKQVYADRQKVEKNWRKSKYRLTKLNGHSAKINCLQIVCDHLVTGSEDGSVRIWDLQSEECVKVMNNSDIPILCLFAVDRSVIVTGGKAGCLIVWNGLAGQIMRTLEAWQSNVTSVRFSEEILVAGYEDGVIMVWDMHTRQSFTLGRHDQGINRILFGNKDTIITFGVEESGKVWNWRTRKLESTGGFGSSSFADLINVPGVDSDSVGYQIMVYSTDTELVHYIDWANDDILDRRVCYVGERIGSVQVFNRRSCWAIEGGVRVFEHDDGGNMKDLMCAELVDLFAIVAPAPTLVCKQAQMNETLICVVVEGSEDVALIRFD